MRGPSSGGPSEAEPPRIVPPLWAATASALPQATVMVMMRKCWLFGRGRETEASNYLFGLQPGFVWFCAFVFDSISYDEVKTLQIFQDACGETNKWHTNGNVFHTLARHHILKNTARKHLVGRISNNQSELPGKR